MERCTKRRGGSPDAYRYPHTHTDLHANSDTHADPDPVGRRRALQGRTFSPNRRVSKAFRATDTAPACGTRDAPWTASSAGDCNSATDLGLEGILLAQRVGEPLELALHLEVFERAQRIYLQLPASNLEPVLKRLRMFVLRAQVVLGDADAELVRFGFAGPDAEQELRRALGNDEANPHLLLGRGGPEDVLVEIYHGLVYEGQEHSILEFSDQAFVLNGFSKLYAMTGFRLGYLIAPPAFIRPIQKMVQNFFISANTMVQKAGVAALTQTDDDTARMRTTYNERRLFLIRRLREMGFGITVEPTGAFYVFANARHISEDSYALAFDILEKADALIVLADVPGAIAEKVDVDFADDEAEEQDSNLDVDDAPLVRYMNKILVDTINSGTSDIHFEPYEASYRVRLRLDGVLHEIANPPHSIQRTGKI